RHAVRVPDGDRGHAERGAVPELERHAHDLAVGPVHRDLRRAEGGAAHLHGHEAHAPVAHVALALDDAALGLHREGRRLRAPPVPEVLREDPEPVAGLLRLAPVRVEDAEAEVGAQAGHAEEDPVGADPPVPVTDRPDRAGGQRLAQIGLVDDDVVVAEAVALRKRDHARSSSTRRPVPADPYLAWTTPLVRYAVTTCRTPPSVMSFAWTVAFVPSSKVITATDQSSTSSAFVDR